MHLKARLAMGWGTLVGTRISFYCWFTTAGNSSYQLHIHRLLTYDLWFVFLHAANYGADQSTQEYHLDWVLPRLLLVYGLGLLHKL